MVLSGVPIDQLPAELRARLEAQGHTLPAKKKRTTRKEVSGPGLPVICWTCKEPCDGETAQVKHMAATGHHRFQALTP